MIWVIDKKNTALPEMMIKKKKHIEKKRARRLTELFIQFVISIKPLFLSFPAGPGGGGGGGAF
jgi:hypothetical protein